MSSKSLIDSLNEVGENVRSISSLVLSSSNGGQEAVKGRQEKIKAQGTSTSCTSPDEHFAGSSGQENAQGERLCPVDTTRFSCRLTDMNKNITLTADETLIHQARRRAISENTSLNELFREWLTRYVAQVSAADRYVALMEQLQDVNAGRSFSREEMNERR